METITPDKVIPATQEDNVISQWILGYRSAKIVFAAVSLNLFEKFQDGPCTAVQIASKLSLNLKASEIFLDALTALRLLKKGPAGYCNSPIAERHLLASSPQSVFHNLRYQNLIWKAWSELDFILSSGAPREDLMTMLGNPAFSEDYLLGMKEINQKAAREVASLLARPDVRRLLDVGAGPGTFSLSLLEICPKLQATLLDLATTLKLTRSIVKFHPEKDRLEFQSGDYRVVDFGRNKYDLILLSHVTHDENEKENLNLLKKAFSGLRKRGRIAIHDFSLDSTRTNPLFSALFSVHMLVYTRGGRTYTDHEYVHSLKTVGCANIERYNICSGAANSSALFVGTKMR